jgi:hypothetical protein
MGFLQKIKFWKKRNNNTPTKVDAFVSTEDPRTCDAATVSIYQTVMCFAYTQTETRMDGGGGAAKEEYQSELEMKTQKIWELEEELAASKRLTADLMLNINSVEQQLRKYAEEPVIRWSDDCDCRQQVSAVADVLRKFVITEKEANNSKPEATSGRNATFDCETQTGANSRQRDCANADEHETLRRLEDKNGQLSLLVEEYERKITLLNEETEQILRDRTSHIQRVKQRYEDENRVLLCKIRDMRDEIISLKERRPSPTERHTEDHQQNERSDSRGRREAGGSSNGKQSANQRHCPNERDFGRKRNLPPRLQNRNLPHRLQNINLPPRLQKAPFCYGEEN